MRFGIALGSNLGDRLGYFLRGVGLLTQRVPPLRVTGAGGVYETEPVDCPPEAKAFLNTVIEVECELSPRELHQHLQHVEQALGRPAEHGHHAPRTVDLDLLYAGDLCVNEPDLVIPHPRLHLRRFVLQPLADFRPDLVLPGQESPIGMLLARLPDDSAAVRLFQREWLPQG